MQLSMRTDYALRALFTLVEHHGGNPIPIGEPFVVMEEELMHPGDPAGSAENVINCQCIELAVAAPKQTSE